MVNDENTRLLFVRGLNDETTLEAIEAHHLLVWNGYRVKAVKANPLVRNMQDAASAVLMNGVVDRMAFESSNTIPKAVSERDADRTRPANVFPLCLSNS